MSSKEGFKDDDRVCCTCLNVEYDPEHIEGGMMRDRWKCKLCGSEFKSKFCIESIQARLDRAEKENAELRDDRDKWFKLFEKLQQETYHCLDNHKMRTEVKDRKRKALAEGGV